MNAIEVGHTFYLGKRYSEPMGAKFTNVDNKMTTFEMGCYGIGVSRIVAAIAELSRDEEGFVWPSSISPYDLSLVEAPKCNQDHVNEVVENLKDLKISFDKRQLNKVGFGAKMINARMLGIPIILVIGKNYPIVELEVRGKRWNESKSKYNYQELYEQNSKDWEWQIIEDGNFEKHLVHKDHVEKVIKSLLKDL
ncbi:unnamed protein product [Wickerhamomyces anomalus]